MALGNLLYDLVKSLNTSEKRTFTVFFSQENKIPRFVQLFKLLDKQSIYDEDDIKSKLYKGKTAQDFVQDRSHLEQCILRVLRWLNDDLNTDVKSLTMLSNAHILKSKNLFLHAIKYFEKSYIDAKKGENFELALTSYDNIVNIKIIKQLNYSFIDDYKIETEYLQSCITGITMLKYAQYKASNSFIKEELELLLQFTELENESSLPLSIIIKKHMVRSVIFNQLNSKEAYLQELKNIIQPLKSIMQNLKDPDHERGFVIIMYNIVYGMLRLDKNAEILEYVDELNNFKFESKENVNSEFKEEFLLRINCLSFLFSASYGRLLDYIIQANTFDLKFVFKDTILVLSLCKALAYFYTQKFKDCRKYIIVQEMELKATLETIHKYKVAFNVLDLIVVYKSGDLDLYESRYRSIYRQVKALMPEYLSLIKQLGSHHMKGTIFSQGLLAKYKELLPLELRIDTLIYF